ncbi:MAG: four helix bundle protein [Mesorhizobium sp.]|nr:four helix bundle protein [Mesorhizobium sp.]
MTSYRDLLVWKAAVELAVECYHTTQLFPKSETYGMTSQIRRASVSIAANIAEGHGREHTGSFVQYLRVAQGSLKELETHLVIVERVGLSAAEDVGRLMKRCDEVGRMMRALIRSLQARQS